MHAHTVAQTPASPTHTLLVKQDKVCLGPPDCLFVAGEQLQGQGCRSEVTSLPVRQQALDALPADAAAAAAACQDSLGQLSVAGSPRPHPAAPLPLRTQAENNQQHCALEQSGGRFW